MPGLTPSLQLEIGQFSDPGRKRANNEDWLGAFQPEDAQRQATKGSLFLVADGMGGHQSGELASRRAVDHVIRTYFEYADTDVQESLAKAIQSANAMLYRSASDADTLRRWGTTLVAAVVRNEMVWIANVGDSRAYIIHKGKMRQLTEDHSWAAAASGPDIKDGWIGRHVITRALGLRSEVKVDLFPATRLVPGDRVLLCSDGLSAPLNDDLIGRLARRSGPQKAAETLVAAANDHGGPDNASVILIEVSRGVGAHWVDMLAGRTWWPSWVPQGPVSALWLALLLLGALVLIAIGFLLGLVIF